MTLTQAKEIIADLQRGLAASQNERIADLARIQELEQNLAQQQTAGIALKKERDALREAAGNLKDELKTLNASQPPTQHRQPQPQPESQQNASNPAVPVQSFFDSEHLKRTQEQSANHAQSAQTTQPKQPVASPLAATSQSDFDALRRKHGSPQQPQAAPVEETVPVSTVQGLIQQAREGIIAEARAELEVIRKNADLYVFLV